MPENFDSLARAESLAAVRRHCVSHAKLYATIGSTAVLGLAALWSVVEAHAASEDHARVEAVDGLERRVDIRASAQEKRLDDLTRTLSESLREVRDDVKTLLRR